MPTITTALRSLEARYGVDPAVLMAIWGHETSYGTVTGSTDLLGALASLGYYGRRRDFFESEFVAALKLMDQGVPRWRLKGSWAGATGYPQFMPSVALRLRADGDGDGYADIWANELDGLASIATYLRDAGWKPNVAWGIPVRTPANLNRAAIVNRTTAPRCPQVYRRHSRWLTMREWRALGVAPVGRSLPENEMASLIEPDGPDATAYLRRPTIARSSITIARISMRSRSGFWRTRLRGDRQARLTTSIGDSSPAHDAHPPVLPPPPPCSSPAPRPLPRRNSIRRPRSPI